VRVEQVLVAIVAIFVAENATPESHHFCADERIDRQLEGLDRRRVRRQAHPSRDRRDLASQLDIALGQTVVPPRT
jgi:hypothetical protein